MKPAIWALWMFLGGCTTGGSTGLPFPADFRFGAATAAHQTEGGNTQNDWYQFETLPQFAGRTASPSAQAVDAWTRFETDADLAAALALSVYRLSLEWSRIEPARGTFDDEALAHYRDVLEALRARALAPSVTLHHFTSPIWVQDLTDVDCKSGSSDQNLCGWSNPEVAVAFSEFVARVAAEYGDLVDEWVTLNEPNVMVLSGEVLGAFPPGRQALSVKAMQTYAVPALRNTLDAHARAYAAVHENDLADADGDGMPARVGIAISAMDFEPAPSTDAALAKRNVVAATNMTRLYNQFHSHALVTGSFDSDFDGAPDEDHPEWTDTLDFLGIQYYARIWVVEYPVFAPLNMLPCMGTVENFAPGLLKAAGCPTPNEPDSIDLMGYEHYPSGIATVTRDYAEQAPGVDLVITENGIATNVGRRRAQSIVRHLEALQPLIAEGIPLRGYYHWALTDNFEWALGFEPRFGLYGIDYKTLARSVTEGGLAYGVIAAESAIPKDWLNEYGSRAGSMTPEKSGDIH